MHLYVRTVLSGLVALALGVAASDTSQCVAPLGMESGAIKDEDITASSSFESGNVGPQHGRVRTDYYGGAWCPKNQITTEPREWIEIDLHTVHVITASGVQGRFGNGQGAEFTEAYLIDYWRPKLGKWVRYKDFKGNERQVIHGSITWLCASMNMVILQSITHRVFYKTLVILVMTGNTNTYIESKTTLDPPIWASKIRLVPFSVYVRTVCMRVELYGCPWNDGIVSYTMPQGDKRGNWEFFDATYDGYWESELTRGLGQLTDGKFGPENFKMGYYEYERGQGWVGWRNDTRGGHPVEIKFEFDKVREFSAIHIYCNNQFTKDVQVFSRANLSFSVGGKHFLGEPISYDYMEDRIFENSRNITIKLHHRVGRFVKLTLGFAARWILVSEITFESDVAHGNFSLETAPEVDSNILARDPYVEKTHPTHHHHRPDLPVSTAPHHEDQTYMAVIIVFLTSIIILLALLMFFTISRHRQRKCFASPLATKTVLAPHTLGTTSGSSCGSYGAKDITSVPLDDPLIMDRLAKLDDYQEPYQALKYAPYYSYSTVVMETLGKHPTTALQSDTSYDYAIPTVPLLGGATSDPPPVPPSLDSFTSKTSTPSSKGSGSRDDNKGKRSPNHQDMLGALKKRLEQTMVPEFPRHRLRMLSKIGEGSFGTLYVAEADGIPEYGLNVSLGKRLVAVKFLTRSAGEKERLDFIREVRILAALEDPHIARVLGMCSEEPLCAVLEYLPHGDLNTFLRNHQGLGSSHSNITTSLSFSCLLYMATQIASGMRYLESLNFVHRDLATRNCLVGKKYEIKISDFATDSDLFADDYYRVHDSTSLPIRWMAWESVRLRKFTTKSDVWSFGVTLWEILNLARHRPYEGLSDLEVLENISHLHADDGGFIHLPTPQTTKDILDLMSECWKRGPTERPSFTEIHLFLQRKNLGYSPPGALS